MNCRGFALSSCFFGRCLLILGSIPLGTAALASDHPARIFPDPLYYSTHSLPAAVAVADFNGDHALDLATANDFGGDISIFLAREDGDFELEHSIPIGGRPSSIAAADFNADGKPDLVVMDLHGLAVVFLGSGDGSFLMNDSYPVSVGEDPHFVAVADLNLDGVPDLAVAKRFSNDVSVLLGVGDGTFHPAHRFPAGGRAYSLAVTDFDQDGFPDLAVAILSDFQEAALLFGQGDGSFGPPVLLGGNQGGVSICAGDFNLDGHPDLAVGKHSVESISVLLGDGAGGIQARISNVARADIGWLAAADFDGDGVPDLATLSGSLPGHADGSFGPVVPFGALGEGEPFEPETAGAIADMDANGSLDVAGANYSIPDGVFILYNDGRGGLGVRAYPSVPASEIVEGDFNSDGFTDLAASGREEISVLPGRGDGTFAPETRVPAENGVADLAAGDFDGDGQLDLAFYQPLSGNFSMLRGTGDGGFQPPVQTTLQIAPTSVAVGEFNGDGRADLVCVRKRSEFLQVLLGKADGTFEVIDQVGPQLVASLAAIGDFNADGKQDLAVAYLGVPYPQVESVAILPGNGNGTFGPGGFYRAGDLQTALAVADLNGDGKLDLAVGHAGKIQLFQTCFPIGCEGVGTVSVLMGEGNGTLGEVTYYDTGDEYQAANSLGVADFDQDGHLDLISNSSTILFGAGDGTFGRVRQFAHFGPGVVGDFNRDGRPDVALANRWILVALNQGSSESNHPPVALAGFDTALECTSSSGAEAFLDGSASSDPDSNPGTSDDIVAFDWFEDYGLSTQQQLGSGETLHLVLPLGVHAVTLRVTDRAGASATSETSIRIADTVPPRISVHLTPDLLWPPNHQMVDISAEVTVTDACGHPGVILSSIQGSGQANASRRSASTGSAVSGAEMGTSDFNFQLRAEQSTSKQGWSYLVTYSATDAAGNQSSATGVVRVYHDRRRSSANSPSP